MLVMVLQFAKIHRYEAFALFQTATLVHLSFCGMRNKTDPDDVAFCILLLQTACGKLHRLVCSNDIVFLCDDNGVHTSYRKVHSDLEFRVREYVYDPTIPVNIEELESLAQAYLSEYGSKGKVGTDGVTHNWFITGNSDDSDDSEEEEEEEEVEEEEEKVSVATVKRPTTQHGSYLLVYEDPCPVEHLMFDGKVQFFNQMTRLPRRGTKTALVGLCLGTNIALKRYSNFTNERRFVFAGNMVVLGRGSTHKSTKRTVYPLM
jgi:hypothetical protein